MLLIQNGRVLDPWTGTDAQLDVLIGNDGVIAKIAKKIDAPADCRVFDAAGLTVSPGLWTDMFISATPARRRRRMC